MRIRKDAGEYMRIRAHRRTCVARDTTGSTSSGEEHDGITHDLDVLEQCFALIVRQLRFGRIELDAIGARDMSFSTRATEADRLHLLIWERSMGN